MRIATFNTWKCDGDYYRRMEMMVEQLKGVDADILLLQECFRLLDTPGTAKTLAAALDMQLSYVPARVKQRFFAQTMHMSESGLAILTKTSPINNGFIRLPGHPEDGERLAQWVLIEKEHRTLLVVNTHLTHLKEREDLRILQAKEILDWIGHQRMAATVVFGGDMNATQSSGLFGLMNSKGWKSPWGSVFPTTLIGPPDACIDHLFLKSRSEAAWDDVGVALDLPDNEGVHPSDHRAVVSELCFG